MLQIKDHKKQIESRLNLLRKINDSDGNVSDSILHLEAELIPLKKQQSELTMIIKTMRLHEYNQKPAE